MQFKKNNILMLFEVILLVFSLTGIWLTLVFVFKDLKFFFGVDYHMIYSWMKGYLETGVFYPPDTLYYNTPIAVTAFGPWLLLPLPLAIPAKFIQTLVLSFSCFYFIVSLRPDMLSKYSTGPFAMAVITGAFVVTQLCYLNIYVEVTFCLLAFLFFFSRGKIKTASFFLAFSVVLKIFLAPVLVVPLLIKQFRLFIWCFIWLVFTAVLSVCIFGVKNHIDMINAVGTTYGKMRLHGIGYPYVSDSFAGWQDFFNKLSFSGLFDISLVFPLTLTMAGLYVCLFLYFCFLVYRAADDNDNEKKIMEKVFGSAVVFCIAFNFRFDHGVLLLAALPFFRDFKGRDRLLFVVSMVVLTSARLMIEKIFVLSGLFALKNFVAGVFSVVSFQFIGINLLLFSVVNYWTNQVNDKTSARIKSDG